MERAIALSKGGDTDTAPPPAAAPRLVIVTRAQWRSRVDLLEELEPSVVVLVDASSPDVVRDARAHAAGTMMASGKRRRRPGGACCTVVALESELERQVRDATAADEAALLADVAAMEKGGAPPGPHDPNPILADPPWSHPSAGSPAGSLGRIVVDARELRSHLPRVLHEAGYLIAVETLAVGDYVLSTDCAVERKAVSTGDLVTSLESGRLWKQLHHLRRYYARPAVLVEFDGGLRSVFSSDGGANCFSDALSMKSVQHKLTRTMIEFPDVRFLWAASPRETVDLFAALKSNDGEGGEQPDAAQARAVGGPATATATAAAADDNREKEGNAEARTFLSKCAGVTRETLGPLVGAADSVADVAALDDSQLQALIGTRPAENLARFLRDKAPEPPDLSLLGPLADFLSTSTTAAAAGGCTRPLAHSLIDLTEDEDEASGRGRTALRCRSNDSLN